MGEGLLLGQTVSRSWAEQVLLPQQAGHRRLPLHPKSVEASSSGIIWTFFIVVPKFSKSTWPCCYSSAKSGNQNDIPVQVCHWKKYDREAFQLASIHQTDLDSPTLEAPKMSQKWSASWNAIWHWKPEGWLVYSGQTWRWIVHYLWQYKFGIVHTLPETCNPQFGQRNREVASLSIALAHCRPFKALMLFISLAAQFKTWIRS